jgi:hypothetical protein|eukprot:COSAG06_NODE_5209_length_3637_cov_10.457976_2_plen_51_part_00
MSSAESMASTLTEAHYSVHGAARVWAQRNCKRRTERLSIYLSVWSILLLT